MVSGPVVTRFAPSPTGFLHIGGARTALFNWAFARHHGGTFLLRIEDTDRARSTDAAIDAILDGMTWLGLDADDAPVYQHRNADRHIEVAQTLLASGQAYKCYCTPEEIESMREAARAAGKPPRYDGTRRDRDPTEAHDGQAYVVRFRAPQQGEIEIDDCVQGAVTIANDQLDDLIILRADGTPTYMLSVVVDDHDMGITHIIRGDDHLTNAARQTQIYNALGWQVPVFAHLPLIYGSDGAKLSKRHGALGVESYRDMGLLPEAMRNYLARLGWSHGNDEIFTTEQLITWFGLEAIGKSPSRFDMSKLENVNGHHIRRHEDSALAALVCGHAPELAPMRATLETAMPVLKERAKNLHEIADMGRFLISTRPIDITEKAAKSLTPTTRARLAALRPRLEALKNWEQASIESEIRAFLNDHNLKLGDIAPALRAALIGTPISPGIFDVVALLDKAEVLGRLKDQI